MQILDRGNNGRLVQDRPWLIRPGGSAPSLSAQMQALLDGTTGFALDPTDVATLWQDAAGTVPVTAASDPVRRINSKWGTPLVFLAPADASRGAWDGTRFIALDGADDYYEASAASDVFRNASGAFVAMRYSGTQNNNGFVGVSTPTATTQRVEIVGSSGRMRTRLRRLDGDAATDDYGTVSTIYTGSTWSFEQDFAVTGNAVKRKDNAVIDTYTLAGTPANTSDTASARVRWGASLGGFVQIGNFGRTVFLSKVPSVGERDLIEAWLTEV